MALGHHTDTWFERQNAALGLPPGTRHSDLWYAREMAKLSTNASPPKQDDPSVGTPMPIPPPPPPPTPPTTYAQPAIPVWHPRAPAGPWQSIGHQEMPELTQRWNPITNQFEYDSGGRFNWNTTTGKWEQGTARPSAASSPPPITTVPGAAPPATQHPTTNALAQPAAPTGGQGTAAAGQSTQAAPNRAAMDGGLWGGTGTNVWAQNAFSGQQPDAAAWGQQPNQTGQRTPARSTLGQDWQAWGNQMSTGQNSQGGLGLNSWTGPGAMGAQRDPSRYGQMWTR